MSLNKEHNFKTYYSIKEVAEIIGVNESLLRYWEKEITQLKPKTGANRVRQYTEKDIDQIKIIYNLVKVRGFKIAAAKKMLIANRQGVEKSAEVLEKLIEVRDNLQTLKDQLNQIS